MHRKLILVLQMILLHKLCFCWGFYAHKEINYHAVFSLPPAMLVLYKPNIDFLKEHAVDPDKRRYAVAEEGCRHYIDLNRYGNYPFETLPRKWEDAVEKFGEEAVTAHGIVPWWVQVMHRRLTSAFRERNFSAILKLSAEIGHYISDAHVPLHAHSNYNGQLTNQHGIHGLWESRIPELLAAKQFNYFVGKASYISSPDTFIWKVVLESAAAADTVLREEKKLTEDISPDRKYAFESRNGIILRQYSSYFTEAYNDVLGNMVERRMRQSIAAVASFWYTAWVDAGQPDLLNIEPHFTPEDISDFNHIDRLWRQTGNLPDSSRLRIRCGE